MRGLNERCDGAAIAFAFVAGAERLGGEGFGLRPWRGQCVTNSDLVNRLLTREAYDMIDRYKLVVKTSRFVRSREVC